MSKAARSLLRSDLAVALLVLVWFAATAWARPLMLPDEGRYVGVAWEMMRSGDWLTPTLNGLPYFHKPPLFYWITAGSMSLFGANEWAARAAPMLGAWAGSMGLYLFVRRWSGLRMARLTLIALVAQPLFYGGAQFANLDMLVAGLITATIVLAAHAALCSEGNQPHRRTLAAAYAAAALAVLAKGLIGIVLPVLVIGAWLLLRRRWRVLRTLIWWPGIGLFLLVAVPWFVAMQRRFAGFLDYFFMEQHFRRFAEGGFNNAQPFWFYFAVLLLAGLPWLPWLIRLPSRGHLREALRSPVRLLMLVWLGVVVLFFSWPQSKLVGYILPALPALAFLIADGYVGFASTAPRSRRQWAIGTGVGAVLGLAAVAWLTIHPIKSSREIAAALAAQRGPHEPVVMLGHYVFDMPFYARLRAPVRVVDDWRDPAIRRSDNWRKELADAARFDEAHAASVLISPGAMAALLCSAPVGWLVGSSDAAERYPALFARAVPVRYEGNLRLWRVDRGASGTGAATPGCAEKRLDTAGGL